jgi:hypothetical protein
VHICKFSLKRGRTVALINFLLIPIQNSHQISVQPDSTQKAAKMTACRCHEFAGAEYDEESDIEMPLWQLFFLLWLRRLIGAGIVLWFFFFGHHDYGVLSSAIFCSIVEGCPLQLVF